MGSIYKRFCHMGKTVKLLVEQWACYTWYQSYQVNSRTYVLAVMFPIQHYMSLMFGNSCARMVCLKMIARNLIIRNKRYVHAKKEREALVWTIEGTIYDNTTWLCNTKTFSHSISLINQERRRMREAINFNFLPHVSPAKLNSLSLSRDMTSKCSVSLVMICRDPCVLPLVEVIVIATSGESKGYVPQNYVSKDRS